MVKIFSNINTNIFYSFELRKVAKYQEESNNKTNNQTYQ